MLEASTFLLTVIFPSSPFCPIATSPELSSVQVVILLLVRVVQADGQHWP